MKTFALLSFLLLAQNRSDNLIYSPFSLSSALEMAEAGADHETLNQLRATLGTTAKPAPGVAQPLATPAGARCRFDVANRIWVDKSFVLSSAYLSTVHASSGASPRAVDFKRHSLRARQEINSWVAEKTEHKILDLVPEGALDAATRVVLTNAVYFKGTWFKPFKKEQTRDRDFRVPGASPRHVPLMHQDFSALPYTREKGYAMIELAYAGEGGAQAPFVLDVLLPDDDAGLAAVEGALTTEGLALGLSHLQNHAINVDLPRFRIASSMSANQMLASLGIKDAFDPARADFSKMASSQDLEVDGKLFISAVLQKAFIEVNEEGTEAAAATAVLMAGAAMMSPSKPVVFRADHPFLFLLRHRPTSEILFVGRVTQPDVVTGI